MKKNTNATWLRSLITFCLMITVFSTYTMVASAKPDNKTLMGELVFSGSNTDGESPSATINGEPAESGRTFFSSGTIATSENSSATIKLGKLGFINLTPNSNLSLSFSENKISGTLSAGQIKVFNSEGVEVNIKTADSLITNEAQQKGIFTVGVQSGATKAFAETGAVFMNNGKTVVPLQTAQDDDDDNNNSAVAPLLIFAGIVSVAVIYVLTKDDKNDRGFVSPVR